MIWKRIRQWVKDMWLAMLSLIFLIICTISCAGADENAWVCVIFGWGIGVVTMILLFFLLTEDEFKDQQPDAKDCFFCIINGEVYWGKVIPDWFDQYGNHIIDFDSRDSRYDNLQYKPTTYSKGGQA